MKKNSRLVYSTDIGRIKPADESQDPAHTSRKSDGIIRLTRETKGRKGKGVTLITGLDIDKDKLKLMAKTLKQYCGVGGAIKEGVIEIQGDQRDILLEYFNKNGYTAKKSGG